MRVLIGVLIVLMVGVVIAAGDPKAQLGPAMVNPGYEEKPDWFKDSFLDIREDVAEAASAGKRVMLYFYQDGCPYCAKLLSDNFADRSIAEKTRNGFDVIAINMWGDREVTGLDGATATEKSFAQGLRVQFTPTLLFLDEQGKVVLRLNGYYPPHKLDVALDYVAGKHERETTPSDYLRRASPVAASGRLHLEAGFMAPPLDFSKNREKPLLLLFEQAECLACDELHQDIFARPEVRASLDNFDVALVDIRGDDELITTEGARSTASRWAADMGIQYVPSLVFFDTGGNEVFRTEAYLRAFHVHGALEYVLSGAYREQPEFQRYLQDRRAQLEAQGVDVDLWK